MSFMSREGERAADIEAYCEGMVRRMVSLPRTLFGGVSRAMTNSLNLMTMGGPSGGRYQRQNSHTSFPSHHFIQDGTHAIPEEWDFLATFEQQYGQSHPFFYACKMVEALRMAEQEHKMVFMYFHSPDHPFTASFCKNTLCSEFVVQYIDANFVSWGALARRGEGLQLAMEMKIETFPFCAVVAPASDSSIAILQQVEGPVSPTELVEILQRTLEEQGRAFGTNKRKEEENRRVESREIREEQDAAYLASLQIDSTKNTNNDVPIEKLVRQKALQEHNKGKDSYKQSRITSVASNKTKQTLLQKDQGSSARVNTRKDTDLTQILIRFPNGERREKTFQSNDTIGSLYKYIDSQNLSGIISYRLLSSFPRKVFGFEHMGMTLKDAGLHPRSSLLLEQLPYHGL